MKIRWMVALTLIGAALAALGDIRGVERYSLYNTMLAVTLAIGLYASTMGIDLKEAARNWRLIVKAVTIGVVLKALLVGGVLVALTGDPFYLLAGIAVAQIDPLSVAALEEKSTMSVAARSILRSWSAFDDPITVMLILYLPWVFNHAMGQAVLPAWIMSQTSPVQYMASLGANVVFVGTAVYLWQLMTRWDLARYLLLVVLFMGSVLFVGAHWLWMFGVALAGLDIRPQRLEKWVMRASIPAFGTTMVLLGVLLWDRLTWGALGMAVVLGGLAYVTQIPVALWLARKLSWHDRWSLALAQQNGITAIILALVLEKVHPGAAAMIAPAVLVINTLHYGANRWFNARYASPTLAAA